MKKIFPFIAALFFSVNLYAQPANNICTTAQVVTPDGTCVSGTTVDATDGWNNVVGCQTGNNNSVHPDVWYSFTATGSQATFTVTAGTFTGNIELILVGGTCAGGLNLVGSQCGASPMNTVFNGLQSGTTYFYTISNTPTGTTGTFQSCVTTTNPPVSSGQDCSTAAILCNTAVINQASSTAGFGTQEVSSTNSCWGSGGERQSRWYKFTIGCSGTLEFNINPNNGANDYDWAIWNITGSPNTCTTKGNAIACNWSGCTGSTGLSSCRTSEPGVKTCMGNQQAYANSTAGNYNPINVIAGNTYTLLVDNFSTSNSGFTLTFGGACNGGTAVIGPDAGFSFVSPSCGTYNFTKTCQTANSSFLWTFGDGNSSTLQNPSHTYSSSGGNYTITLQITDALGCVKTSSQTVSIVSTAAPALSSNSPLCEGNTLNLTTPSITGATYSWTGPNGFASTSQNPVISNITSANAGTYSLILTVSGCVTNPGTVLVTINPLPASPTALGTTICSGNTATLTATAPGGTYQWYTAASGGTLLITGAVYTTPVLSATTTYYVQTTSVNGCISARTAVTVTVNPTPATPTASYNNSPVLCVGSTIMLAATTITGATYSWTGPNSFASTAQNPSIANATTAMSGTYSVIAIVNSCSSAVATVNVTINANPIITSINETDPLSCGVNNGAITINATGSGLTYSINGGSSFAASNTFTGLGAGSYSIVVMSSAGCTVQGSASLSSPGAPAAPMVSSSTNPLCQGATLIISVNSPDATFAYNWTGPNGYTSLNTTSITINNVTTAMGGTYSVTANASGCVSDAGTIVIQVNANPVLNITNPPAVCSPATVDITAASVTSGSTGAGTLTYWTNAGATASLTSPNAVSASGTYYIQSSASGCTDIEPVTVIINTTPVLSITNPAAVCSPAMVDLTTASVTAGSTGGGTLSYWTNASATTVLTSPSAVSSSGTYYIQSTASSCSDIEPVTVTINPSPVLSITNPAAVCSPATVDITAASVTSGSTGAGTLTYWT
ncbi:MAG TPA: PKD domain-containing protein, partial [Bacteroidia bacterium]|nr:PKD domain-containing protein [Bacteroidia bacterium]